MNRFASRQHPSGATAKHLQACRRRIGALLLIPLLVSCGQYLDTSPDRKLVKRVEERLKPDEGLPLPAISQLPPQTVEQALPKFKEGRPKSATILPPPSATKPELPKAAPEASKQLSITAVRSMALENNLDLKIAQADPKIAATSVSEEQAKFDDLIFAKAKYGKKTPRRKIWMSSALRRWIPLRR